MNPWTKGLKTKLKINSSILPKERGSHIAAPGLPIRRKRHCPLTETDKKYHLELSDRLVKRL